MAIRCSRCKRRIKELPFRCHHCNRLYCSKHRLPEDHNCNPFLRKQEYKRNQWDNEIRNIYHRPKEQNEHHTYKLSWTSKLRKLWYRNRRILKNFLKIIIILLVIYFLFQYYQNNETKINNLVGTLLTNVSYKINNLGVVEHTNPIIKTYPVNTEGLNGIQITLHESVYNYFVNEAPHSYSYSSYSIDSEPPAGWEEDYWKMFLTNDNDDYIINEIVTQTTTATKSDGDKAARAIARFVQEIPYDWDAFYSNSQYMQYPYETLYLDKGVCAEKAVLMAKLLNELGYGVALFEYKKENHMAVGIKCPYDKSNYKTGYCFIEPSDVYPIGSIPPLYVGGIQLQNTPQLVFKSEGKAYSK